MNNQQTIGIKIAIDAASGRAEVVGLSGDLLKLQGAGNSAASGVDAVGKSLSRTSEMAQLLKGALTGAAIVGFTKTVMGAATQAESSLKGLESVANYTGVGMAAALQTAGKLSADGMMTTAEASRALQNLLSRGYSIEQAEATLNRLKDSAAFNRQAHLAMGEAVVTATEGLKNENSILVDNAGVTKNVSQMWKEYAQKIGVGVDSLTTAQKIQAEYGGILRETQGQLGNAAKAAQGYQGAQAELNKTLQEFEAHVGQSLTPVMIELTKEGTHVITDFLDPFIDKVKAAGVWTGFLGRAISNVSHADFSALDRDYVSALHWRDMGATKPAGAAASGANPQKAGAFQSGLSGADEAAARDKKAIAKSDLELAEAKAKAEHNVRALTDAYAGQLMAEGRLSASAARHIAEQNAQKDALGWTASASKALETTQASLADKVNDMEIALRLEAASLGLSERETAGLESAKKLLTETNAKGLAQLQQEPAVVERAIELGRRQYDVDMARAEAKRQLAQSIDDFNSRQGIANGLSMQADRAQRELSTMRGLRADGLYGEKLQREMSIQRNLMDTRQALIDKGSSGEGLAASMAQAEANIRKTEAATWEMNQALERTETLGHDIGMTLASSAENAILHWQGFGNLIKSIGLDLAQIALRVGVTEPLTKAASGFFSNAFSSVGGLFGGSSGAGSAVTGAGLADMSFASLDFAFANGGIMTASGSLPLHKYASGGIANRPQLALFGEGRLPEAYVPLPDGRSIPVTMQGGGGGTVVQVIDQRQGGAAIEQQRSTDASGVEVIRLIVRDEVQRNVPGAMRMALAGGTLDKDFAGSFGLRRTGR